MYALPIQGENDPKYTKHLQEEHSTSGTRLPAYQDGNDLYNSEREIARQEIGKEKELKHLKDGQEVFTASQSIHRDDFIAVSLFKPEKKVEEQSNRFESEHEDGDKYMSNRKKRSKENSKMSQRNNGNDTFNKSAYETRWDSDHYDNTSNRRSNISNKNKRQQNACCQLI